MDSGRRRGARLTGLCLAGKKVLRMGFKMGVSQNRGYNTKPQEWVVLLWLSFNLKKHASQGYRVKPRVKGSGNSGPEAASLGRSLSAPRFWRFEAGGSGEFATRNPPGSASRYLGVAQNLRARVTQVLVFVSMQGA